jgi:hypothetical protein
MGKIIVRQATPADQDLVFPLFTGFATHSQVDPQDWKKIFHNIWRDQNPCCGFILLDGEDVVGFLGTLFSRRMIQGSAKDFCNLTSWIVKPEYRSESLSLLFPLMGRKNLTLTNFTASNRVIAVLQKIGFRSLEDHFHMLLPFPLPAMPCRIILDSELIENRLMGENQRIYQDHLKLHCFHVIVETPEGDLYLVLNPTRKKKLPVMFVNFLSDPFLFEKYIQRCVFTLCRKLGICGLMVGDHSLVSGPLPYTLKVPRRHALLYHSRDLSPAEIDTLYSEIQVLGLKPV